MNALPNAYLNGEFLPLTKAWISPLDRGFLFGDAAYEVVPVYDGKPFLLDAHLARLERSLRSLHIDGPMTLQQWRTVVHQLTANNGAGDLAVYLQVTRGADEGRDHRIPRGLTPTVFAMASELPRHDYSSGLHAITRSDNRWERCDIKSTALLANVLARHEALEAGADDAILLRDGAVTEAASSSVLIVEQGKLYRRPNGNEILPGTTTDFVVELAREAGLHCHDERISEQRLRRADEIWLTAATKGLAPVVTLDGAAVGDGTPGPIWRQVATMFEARRCD